MGIKSHICEQQCCRLTIREPAQIQSIMKFHTRYIIGGIVLILLMVVCEQVIYLQQHKGVNSRKITLSILLPHSLNLICGMDDLDSKMNDI